eukprot:TRINITY_DN59137_c0_g1_i1.p3 TRINITY_DN59137_c0_g1~~TRINITY_DN59137_c0_g1_i1.p3  ORF type:complete len:118 (+),score=23.68 TRINITY_DN59137_c0_g1_i1:81-434(+)
MPPKAPVTQPGLCWGRGRQQTAAAAAASSAGRGHARAGPAPRRAGRAAAGSRPTRQELADLIVWFRGGKETLRNQHGAQFLNEKIFPAAHELAQRLGDDALNRVLAGWTKNKKVKIM